METLCSSLSDLQSSLITRWLFVKLVFGPNTGCVQLAPSPVSPVQQLELKAHFSYLTVFKGNAYVCGSKSHSSILAKF